jgi:hypothetical protein
MELHARFQQGLDAEVAGLIGAAPSVEAIQSWASRRPDQWLQAMLFLIWMARGAPEVPEEFEGAIFDQDVVAFADRVKIAQLEFHTAVLAEAGMGNG